MSKKFIFSKNIFLICRFQSQSSRAIVEPADDNEPSDDLNPEANQGRDLLL